MGSGNHASPCRRQTDSSKTKTKKYLDSVRHYITTVQAEVSLRITEWHTRWNTLKVFDRLHHLWYDTRAASRTLFSYENLGSTAREFSRKCETLRCENSMLAIICPLLLTNGIDVLCRVLWAGLATRSKEISCSRNLVAARDFYDAIRTLCASSYENLVEKNCETRLRTTMKLTTINVTSIMLGAVYIQASIYSAVHYIIIFTRKLKSHNLHMPINHYSPPYSREAQLY